MTLIDKVKQNEEIIKDLCVCNGLSYEKMREDGSEVEALEMFFSGFPRMVRLSLFPRLLTLTIVGQDVCKIQGLDDCPLLRELWVAECRLTVISGLQKCAQLQKLFLYDNKISEIRELESLINLRVLWLNNNLIPEIKGLSTLENLTELNLADNLITSIGKSLEQNKRLQSLNLSGNTISSFKELTQLACLTELKELGLNDPQSSPNPVCLLFNYFTHLLYHIPTLHTLDSYDVSEKNIKDAAESTVMKKRMYYHMRVRCVQRQFDQTKHTLQQQKKKVQQLPVERIHTLSHTLKHLECESEAAGRKLAGLREEVTSEWSGDFSDYEHSVKKKLMAIRERIKVWERRLEEVEERFQLDVAMASDGKDMSIHFLVMELETVGNIRFEEGNTSHAWFKPCYDLLLSRFCAWDYKAYNISGIKINRIMRVYNRILRLNFEDKLCTLLANNESSLFSQNYRRRLEYLFYVFDPERCTEEIQCTHEILNILENGFQSAGIHKAVGRDSAVPLSNSVSVCEEPRIRLVWKKATRRGAESADEPLPITQGQLIISKAFLGHSVPLRAGVPVDEEFYPKAHSVYRKKASTRKHATTQDNTQDNTEEVCSSELQGCCDCSQRQTLWYVFDHELVLPEYLINFEYITQERSQSSSSSIPGPPGAPVAPDDVTPVCNDEQALDEQVLALEPVLKPQPKLLSLDERNLLTAARANVLSQITVLNLHGNSLCRLKEVSSLTTLRQLTVSFNALTHLDDVSYLYNLEYVDASFNQIVTLEGVRGLPCLRELDLRWNQLSRAQEDTSVLCKHTPFLQRLDTRHNPWRQDKSVRMVALGSLKTLTHLDGVLVTEDEVAVATQVNSTSKINLMLLLSHSRTDADRPRCLSLLPAAQLLTHLNPSPWKYTTDLEPGWSAKITVVNLDGQRLSHIDNLEQLVNLRWASFNNNQLTHIEGLQHCPLLEELSLNHNYIWTLEGLSKLQRLSRLSINSNRLQCLDASMLECLMNLHFLSVEDNCITSLQGVQRLRFLFELYVGNNIISTSRDIYHLKTLSNLIILDLYGNPLTTTLDNYRAYVIFHLPFLKALDGTAVELSEYENAKDVFGGRLTADMLTEKLGHCNYKEMEELELPGCSVRMVDLVPTELFENLRSVNLERNNLTSFSGLVYLPNIKVLYLNYNHIESILPRQKTHLSNRQQLYLKVHSSGYGQQSSKNSRECVCVESLEPLMCSLEVLHLGYNGISNLCDLQLSRLSSLRALFLPGNEIVQVEGLDGLSHLRELVLDQNRVKTLCEKWFRSHTRLIELSLNDNRLRSLTYLQLIHLQRLHLNNNKLQDITELDKLEVLTSLVELSVVGNPVSRRSLHRPSVVLRLPQLQVLDGITITLEERTRAELLSTEDTPPSADMPFPVVLSHAPPARTTALAVSIHPLHRQESVISVYTEDTHYKRTYKRQRPGVTHARSAQSNILRGALNLTGLLRHNYRAFTTHNETTSRYPSGAKRLPRN